MSLAYRFGETPPIVKKYLESKKEQLELWSDAEVGSRVGTYLENWKFYPWHVSTFICSCCLWLLI